MSALDPIILSLSECEYTYKNLASEHCYEDYFNPAWFLDEEFIVQTFVYGKVCIRLFGLPWDTVQTGAGYNRIGHTLWAAGHVLAQYLVENPSEVGHKRVLEIGCGLGLTGLVAAKLSSDPTQVVLTDGDDNIMDAIQLNINSNFTDDRFQPRCDVLFWGATTGSEFAKVYGRFDLVIGADVLYSEASLEPLIITACDVMDVDAKLLIAFQPKYGGRFRDAIVRLAVCHGLVARCIDWKMSQELCTRLLDCEEEDDCDVELWQFIRNKNIVNNSGL